MRSFDFSSTASDLQNGINIVLRVEACFLSNAEMYSISGLKYLKRDSAFIYSFIPPTNLDGSCLEATWLSHFKF